MHQPRHYLRSFLTIGLTSSLLLSACSAKKTEPTKTDENKAASGTVIYALPQDAKMLNPTLSGDSYSSLISGFVFDGLVTFDDKAEVKPALAKSWQIKDDLVYTFTLRDDVKFHDGTKFTAKDVAFTYNSILHPQYTGQRRSNYTAIKGVKELDDAVAKLDAKAADYDAQAQKLWENFVKTGGIQVKNDTSIEITLAEVSAPFMVNAIGMGILPEHIYKGTEGKKMADVEANQKPVGTGAMKFVEWKKGDFVKLEQNPDWKFGLFGHPFRVKNFQLKVVPNAQAAMAALENGEVDVAGLDADNWDKFTKISTLNSFEYLAWSYSFIGYNVNYPPLADKKVRQALTSALDRAAVIRDLRRGHAQPIDTHGAPGRWDYNDKVKKFPYDPAAAGKLLDEAGWKMGPNGIREKDGKKLTITFTNTTGSKFTEQLAALIQQNWKAVGVDVTIDSMKFETMIDKLKTPNEIQAWPMGWSLGVEPDAYSIWHSKGGFAYMTHWSNPDVDKAYEEGRKTTDITKRKALYAKAQEILAEEQPYTWVSYSTSLWGASKNIKGIKPSPAVGFWWNMEEWTSDSK